MMTDYVGVSTHRAPHLPVLDVREEDQVGALRRRWPCERVHHVGVSEDGQSAAIPKDKERPASYLRSSVERHCDSAGLSVQYEYDVIHRRGG